MPLCPGLLGALSSLGVFVAAPREDLLVVMADSREPELRPFAADERSLRHLAPNATPCQSCTFAKVSLACGPGRVGHWTRRYLEAAARSLKGGFSFKYFKCRGGPVDVHWCKVVVLERLVRRPLYKRILMIDTDVALQGDWWTHMTAARVASWERALRTRMLVAITGKSQGFQLAPLVNASLVTALADGCGLRSMDGDWQNVHCTAIMYLRAGGVARELLQAWLAKLTPKSHRLPYHEQRALNSIRGQFGSKVAALPTGMFEDDWTAAGCQELGLDSLWVHNDKVLLDNLASPGAESIAFLKHDRSKGCSPIPAVQADIGESLPDILQRTALIVEDIIVKFGSVDESWKT